MPRFQLWSYHDKTVILFDVFQMPLSQLILMNTCNTVLQVARLLIREQLFDFMGVGQEDVFGPGYFFICDAILSFYLQIFTKRIVEFYLSWIFFLEN